MDRIYLRDIELKAVIGVYAWEQQIEQKLILSLELSADLAVPARDDNLLAGIDYGAVLKRVQELVATTRVQLLETLAERIAQLILSEFAVSAVRVDLAKHFIFPQVPRVGVVIERTR